jgi:glycosyltransferase involved in cell wall biosynthesis
VDGGAMHRFYANSRIYVGPSLYEPFGLSPLEAAAQGCALLLSSIGSFRELWHDAAVFFESARPRVLGAQLMDMIETPHRLDELGRKARERARSRYTAQRMTDQYEALYHELAGHRRVDALSPAGGTRSGAIDADAVAPEEPRAGDGETQIMGVSGGESL